MRKCLFTISVLLLFLVSTLSAQTNFWKTIPKSSLDFQARKANSELPTEFESFDLDYQGLADYLKQAPMEFTPQAKTNALRLDVPLPNGASTAFEMVESKIMEDRLADRYKNIKTYFGLPLDKSARAIRLVMTYRGLYGVIDTPEGQVYIDPFVPNQIDQSIVYYTKNDLTASHSPDVKTCGVTDIQLPDAERNWHPDMKASNRSLDMTPVEFKTFRLAIATTGEWTSQYANSDKEEAMDILAINVARINSVYEREFAFRLVFNEFQDRIIHTDASTDPYQNANSGGSLLGQNTEEVNKIIGPASYDFGHIYTANCNDVGGIANLGSFCGENKAGGVTCCSSDPTLWGPISIALHEMGHQLAGAHTFNNCSPGSSGNGHEPGSGSTILSYGGLCGTNNVETVRDDYYNIGNLQQIFNFLNSGADDCGVASESGNHYPEVEIEMTDGFYIPISTPFELTATTSDPDDDVVMHCWEQFDLGPQSPLGFPTGNAPSFRSYYPEESNTRIFPKLLSILTNFEERVEVLPTYSRDFTFRCTVRDFSPLGGGTSWDDVSFKATEEAGPFLINYPSEFTSIEGGTYTEVTWDVANTDQPPVNCKAVDILLSTDGGFSFPDTLAKSVFNDGSHFVYFPDVNSTTVRIKVKASDNIFFDISNRPFQVFQATAPGYTMNVAPYYKRHCNPGVATFEINSAAFQDFNEPINLSTASLPADVTASFSKNPIMPGESATLSVDLTDADLDEIIMIEAIAIAGTDTTVHDVHINVINSDFSAVVGNTPINGAFGVSGVPEFTWGSTPNAIYYDFEVSYSPSFDELIYSEYGKLDNEFTPPAIFDKTSTVYWRVRGANECTIGEWQYSAFQTESFECSFFFNQALNLPIPKQTGTVINSVLFVPESGIIEDLDINQLNIDFAPISALDIRLTSPDGNTEVVLMSDQCANTGEVRVTFNDEASDLVQCPPNNFVPYQPLEPLSVFDGMDIAGEWNLRIEILESGFSIGKLNSWNLETCAAFQAQNPFVVTNEVLPVKTDDSKFITKEYLEVKDNDNTSTELTYNLLAVPEHGTLEAYGIPLEAGQSFLQDFIYDYAIKYTHNGNDAVSDAFFFTVTDGNGGLLGVTKFEIEIDPNNLPVSTFTPVSNNELILAPNPANSQVNVQLGHPLLEESVLNVFDLSGRQLNSIRLAAGSQQQLLDIAGYSEGVYIVQLHTGQQLINKKLIVVK